MPTLPNYTHGAHCIYQPALARLLSSCGALRWSWSCPAQVVHPGWCRHCTASRWSLHWSRHSSATHNTLPSHIIHPYRRKHCTADMHKIAVGAFYLGVILFSTSDSHSTHTLLWSVVTPASALPDPGLELRTIRHGEGPYLGLFLVESAYKCLNI